MRINKILLFYLIFFLSLSIKYSVYFAQTFWTQAVNPQIGEIYSMQFINSDVGFIAHNEGISKTTDGGQTWNKINLATNSFATYFSIYALNEDKILAGGDSLFYTEDCGESWQKINLQNLNGKIKKIMLINDSSYIILVTKSNYGQIYKGSTINNNWNLVFELTNKDIYDFDFYNSVGILVGKDKSVIYRSTNYGQNWIQSSEPNLIYANYTRTDIRTVKFVNENLIYAAGWGSYVGYQKTIIINSTDGGLTWQQVDLDENNSTYANIYASIVLNDGKFLLGGGFSYDGSIMLLKKDAINNFNKIKLFFGFTINCFAKVNNFIYAAGDNGAIIKSVDEAENWQLISKSLNVSFYDIEIKGNNIYLGGFNGSFAKSTDNGNTWQYSYVSNSINSSRVNSLFFLNENIGYAAKSFGGLSKTTNGGLNWFSVLKDTVLLTASNESVYFVNDSLGFVVGRLQNNYDIIYKTTNAGLTWTKKEKLFSKNINSIIFFNDYEGIVVGSSSLIAYTTNQGETWIISDLPPSFPNTIFVNSSKVNDSVAIAIGGSYILISYDKGKNWNIISSIQGYTLQKAKFFNDSIAYLCGYKIESGLSSSVVFMSNDGGKNWENIFPSNFNSGTFQAYALNVNTNGEVFLTGSKGLIFIMRNTLTAEKSTNKQKNFNLFPNYPNPFNSTTKISFYLPEPDYVIIKIFDILGKNVYNSKKYYTAGINILEFNADEYKLKSGVYIYIIEYQDNIKLQKMLFLK